MILLFDGLSSNKKVTIDMLKCKMKRMNTLENILNQQNSPKLQFSKNRKAKKLYFLIDSAEIKTTVFYVYYFIFWLELIKKSLDVYFILNIFLI